MFRQSLMPLGHNTQYLIDRLGGTYTDIAQHCKTDPQAIQILVKRDSRKSRFASGIASYFNVPVEILLAESTGPLDVYISYRELNRSKTGQYSQESGQSQAIQAEENLNSGYVPRVPVIGLIKPGSEGGMSIENLDKGGTLQWGSDDPAVYSYKVHGDIMSPRFRHGEYLIISPLRKVRSGDEVIILRSTSADILVCLYLYEKDGMVMLEDVIGGVQRYAILREDITYMHVIAGCVKDIMHVPDKSRT